MQVLYKDGSHATTPQKPVNHPMNSRKPISLLISLLSLVHGSRLTSRFGTGGRVRLNPLVKSQTFTFSKMPKIADVTSKTTSTFRDTLTKLPQDPKLSGGTSAKRALFSNPSVKQNDQPTGAPSPAWSTPDLKQGDKEADSNIDTATSRNDTLKAPNLKQDHKSGSVSSSKSTSAKVEEAQSKAPGFSTMDKQVSSEASVLLVPQPQVLLVKPEEIVADKKDVIIANEDEPKEVTQVHEETCEKVEETADEEEVLSGGRIEDENNENIPKIPHVSLNHLVQDHPLPDPAPTDDQEDLVNENAETTSEASPIKSDPNPKISARLAGLEEKPKAPVKSVKVDNPEDSVAVQVQEGSEGSSSFLAKGWSFLKKAAYVISVLGAIGSVPIGIFYYQHSRRNLP